MTGIEGHPAEEWPVRYGKYNGCELLMNKESGKSEPDSEHVRSSRQASAGDRRRWTGWLAFLLIAAVVTVNLWIMAGQLTSMRESRRERAFWALCRPGITPEKRAEYFLQLAADGNSEWRSAILKDLILDGVDLANVSLNSAVFSGCSFVRADFSQAELNKAGLDSSDLTDATFFQVQARDATFFKSELHGAQFRNADLLSASFEQTKAHNAVFVTAKMGDCFLAMADLTGADFTGADLSSANLEAAVLKNADLALANLYGAVLTDADFTDSNWWRSRGLNSAQLDRLTLLYPPTPNAEESRQRDFEIWLSKRISDIEKEQPDP